MKFLIAALVILILALKFGGGIPARAAEGKLIIVECEQGKPCRPRLKEFDGRTACELDTSQLVTIVPSGTRFYCQPSINWIRPADPAGDRPK